jgi:hypothetical protein
MVLSAHRLTGLIVLCRKGTPAQWGGGSGSTNIPDSVNFPRRAPKTAPAGAERKSNSECYATAELDDAGDWVGPDEAAFPADCGVCSCATWSLAPVKVMLTSSICRLNAEVCELPPLLPLPCVSALENRIVSSWIWRPPPDGVLFAAVAPVAGALASVIGAVALFDDVPSATGWEPEVADVACINRCASCWNWLTRSENAVGLKLFIRFATWSKA